MHSFRRGGPLAATADRLRRAHGGRRALWSAAFLTLIVVGGLLLGACAGPELDRAPSFSLASAERQRVSLSDLLAGNEAVVLVFYRGFF